jgi:retron-type reverse transcriptase
MDLQTIFSPDGLRLAWKRYILQTQQCVKDYPGLLLFSQALDDNLADLSDRLISKSFEHEPAGKFFKPKPNGMQRSMTIIPVESAVALQAIADVVAASAYEDLSVHSESVLGSVLSEGVGQGRKILETPRTPPFFFQHYVPLYKKFADLVNQYRDDPDYLEGYSLETDITGFFDAIPHSILLNKLRKYGLNDDVLDWLGSALNLWSGTQEQTTPGVGIPQGAAASHFFANLILHDLDKILISQGAAYYRYMDDIRLFDESRSRLQCYLLAVDRYLKSHGLSLNSKKTQITRLTTENKDEGRIRFQLVFASQADDVEQVTEQISLTDQSIGRSSLDSMQLLDLADEDAAEQWAKAALAECSTNLKLLLAAMSAESPNEDQRERLQNSDTALKDAGFRVRTALGFLAKLGCAKTVEHTPLMQCWLALIELPELAWFYDKICWNLTVFNDEKAVQDALAKLLIKYQSPDSDVPRYEWATRQIIDCAQRLQFSDKELWKLVFPYINPKGHPQPWYVRQGAYILLRAQAQSPRLQQAVEVNARQERNPFLRRQLLLERVLDGVDDEDIEALIAEYGAVL